MTSNLYKNVKDRRAKAEAALPTLLAIRDAFAKNTFQHDVHHHPEASTGCLTIVAKNTANANPVVAYVKSISTAPRSITLHQEIQERLDELVRLCEHDAQVWDTDIGGQ